MYKFIRSKQRHTYIPVTFAHSKLLDFAGAVCGMDFFSFSTFSGVLGQEPPFPFTETMRSNIGTGGFGLLGARVGLLGVLLGLLGVRVGLLGVLPGLLGAWVGLLGVLLGLLGAWVGLLGVLPGLFRIGVTILFSMSSTALLQGVFLALMGGLCKLLLTGDKTSFVNSKRNE